MQTKYLFIAVAFFIVGYVLTRLFKPANKFQEYYSEIINSDEYKVKGRFE